jgi:hypothetical protein
MDNNRDILNELIYEGIYRDDSIAVLKESVTTGKVAKWLGIFQARVNHLADSKFLEFTAEIWGNDKDNVKKYKAVRTTNKNYFLFSVFRYGNVLVSGRQSTIQSTPERESSIQISQPWKYAHRCLLCCHSHRSHERLAYLTTRTEESELMRMDELYPVHAKALKKANLAPDTFPTLGKILDNQQMDPAVSNVKEKKNNQDTQTVQFCSGMSKWWNNPVHAILKELRNKHELTWL